jgi:hypothetical protein
MDISILDSNDHWRDILYDYSFRHYDFLDAEDECRLCQEKYAGDLFHKTKFFEDDPLICEQCVWNCFIVHQHKIEEVVHDNSVFCKDNVLHIITKKGIIIKFDFATLKSTTVPFKKVVPDILTFKPPKRLCVFDTVNYPEKFESPILENGLYLDTALANLLNMKVAEFDESYRVEMFANFVIDKDGKAEGVYVSAYDQLISKSMAEDSRLWELEAKVSKWILAQRFDWMQLPKNFDKFEYHPIMRFK